MPQTPNQPPFSRRLLSRLSRTPLGETLKRAVRPVNNTEPVGRSVPAAPSPLSPGETGLADAPARNALKTTAPRAPQPHVLAGGGVAPQTGVVPVSAATGEPAQQAVAKPAKPAKPSLSSRLPQPPATFVAPKGRRPRIGLVGFFGQGNYGDELFVSVFEQFFGPDFELSIVVDMIEKPYYSRPVEEIVSELDAIVIGGGDLLRPWSVDERWFHPAYLGKPVYIVGMGVPIRVGVEEKEWTIAKYRRYLQHPSVRFIGVRDESSRAWIEKNIYPTAPLRSEPDIVCALALPPVVKPAEPVLGIVTRLRPNRDIPDDYSRLQELAAQQMERGWKVRHIILGTGMVGRNDLENANDLDVPGKELVFSDSLEDLSRAIGECTVLASMKFHGSVVATMYEVPSIVLIPTSKNRSFMQRIGRDDLVAQFDAKDLRERFSPQPAPHDHAAIERLRERATGLLNEVTGLIKQDLEVAASE